MVEPLSSKQATRVRFSSSAQRKPAPCSRRRVFSFQWAPHARLPAHACAATHAPAATRAPSFRPRRTTHSVTSPATSDTNPVVERLGYRTVTDDVEDLQRAPSPHREQQVLPRPAQRHVTLSMLTRHRDGITTEVQKQFHVRSVVGMQVYGAARKLGKSIQRNPRQKCLGPLGDTVGSAVRIGAIRRGTSPRVHPVLCIESVDGEFVQLPTNPIVRCPDASPRGDFARLIDPRIGVEHDGGGLAVVVEHLRAAFRSLYCCNNFRHPLVCGRVQCDPRHSMNEGDMTNQLLDRPVRHRRHWRTRITRRERTDSVAFVGQNSQLLIGSHIGDPAPIDAVSSLEPTRIVDTVRFVRHSRVRMPLFEASPGRGNQVEALVLVILVVAAVVFLVVRSQKNAAAKSASTLEDAKADARQSIERLGGQVYNLIGTDTPSKQALADASERNIAAGSQIDQARTVEQARLAKQTALEGLYYIRAARLAMGMDPGPEIQGIDGQKSAGQVTEDRKVDFEGRQVEASPNPSDRTPNYYPGGKVAGRPVPAGWYSEPWWRPALVAGAWGVGSMFLFSAMFSGMAGVPYDQQAFESGTVDGSESGGEFGDAGGGDMGGGEEYGAMDDGGGDMFGGDGGGMFDGGFDF